MQGRKNVLGEWLANFQERCTYFNISTESLLFECVVKSGALGVNDKFVEAPLLLAVKLHAGGHEIAALLMHNHCIRSWSDLLDGAFELAETIKKVTERPSMKRVDELKNHHHHLKRTLAYQSRSHLSSDGMVVPEGTLQELTAQLRSLSKDLIAQAEELYPKACLNEGVRHDFKESCAVRLVPYRSFLLETVSEAVLQADRDATEALRRAIVDDDSPGILFYDTDNYFDGKGILSYQEDFHSNVDNFCSFRGGKLFLIPPAAYEVLVHEEEDEWYPPDDTWRLKMESRPSDTVLETLTGLLAFDGYDDYPTLLDALETAQALNPEL